MQTVPQVLRVILPFVYCTVISGLFLQIFSTFSASLGSAIFIYWKVCFQTAPFLVLGLLLLKGGFFADTGELVSWNYTEPETWIQF